MLDFFSLYILRTLSIALTIVVASSLRLDWALAQESDFIQQAPPVADANQIFPPAEISNWNFNIDVTGGFSNNVAKFEGSPEGSFIQSSQNIEYATQLRESVELRLQGGGFLRNFTDPDINDKFRMAVYNGLGEITTILSPQLDMGFQLKGESFQGRELDFTNNLGLGRDFRFFSVSGSTFLRHYRSEDMFELRLQQQILNALTTTIDESGNLFRNSVNTTTIETKYTRQFYDFWSTEFLYSFSYKKYLERRARLSNGAIDPSFQTDFLIENEHRFTTRTFLYNLQIELGVEFIDDRVFSAETRYSVVSEVSLPITILQSLNLRPFALWSPTFYTNFIGDIINNSLATELRRDQYISYGGEVGLSFDWFQPIVTYQHNELNSNYQILNFSEDSFSVGVRLNF